LVTNQDSHTTTVVALTKEAGSPGISREELGLGWPPQVYSLSHVAIPFPPNDPLYGEEGRIKGTRIPKIGAWHPRGEKGILKISAAQFMRIRYNPFYAYLQKRLEKDIP